MDRQWLESRRDVIDGRLNDLDFFGAALEATPWRETFWPSYERLADAVLSLRQMILDCMEAKDGRDAGPSACLGSARRHVEDAALRLSEIVQEPLLRRSLKDSPSDAAWLEQLSRWATESQDRLEVKWDHLLKAYDAALQIVRLAHIAHPTGEMDQ